MNCRLSALDKISLISNSDAHSLGKLGREANVFECQMSYGDIMSTIKSKNPEKFLYTIEFFPEEGKYHFDGHRACNVSFSPKETKKNNGICPQCGRSLTVGVLNRVEELSDRPEGEKPTNAIPYKNLISLSEIIAGAKNVGTQTKTVQVEYDKLIEKFGSELFVLLEAQIEEISEVTDARIAEGVKRMRECRVKIEPGHDGEYGKISLFEEGEEIKEDQAQESLF
jgi:uncharacterized protein (TIGR00375 family)